MAARDLAQEHVGNYCPVAYLCKSSNPKSSNLFQGMHVCLCSVAALALMVMDAEKSVRSHPLTLPALHHS